MAKRFDDLRGKMLKMSPRERSAEMEASAREFNHGILRYPVTLTPRDNVTIVVTFPDVPQAATFGDTREKALANAQEAFAKAIESMMRHGDDVPAPSFPRGGDSIVIPEKLARRINRYWSEWELE
jgi:predicted RNase H-like HicB family nuclease